MPSVGSSNGTGMPCLQAGQVTTTITLDSASSTRLKTPRWIADHRAQPRMQPKRTGAAHRGQGSGKYMKFSEQQEEGEAAPGQYGTRSDLELNRTDGDELLLS